METTFAQSASFAHNNASVEAVVAQPHVVLNDTTDKGAVSAQGFTASQAAIEQLVIEAEVWHNTAFKTSNEQLYGLLAKCYGVYLAMSGDSDEAKALRKGLTDYINLKGHKFSKGSHTINKIVKCVFGFDRRRVSAYGIVLRTALANKVATQNVPDFIRNSGGVEEIRLAKSPNAMTPKAKAQIASSTVTSNDLGSVSSTALSAMLDAGKVGTNTVLIGTWQADGSIIVRSVVESDTALNAALASYYSAYKEAIKAQEKAAEKAAEEILKRQAQQAAAESATVTI